MQSSLGAGVLLGGALDGCKPACDRAMSRLPAHPRPSHCNLLAQNRFHFICCRRSSADVMRRMPSSGSLSPWTGLRITEHLASAARRTSRGTRRDKLVACSTTSTATRGLGVRDRTGRDSFPGAPGLHNLCCRVQLRGNRCLIRQELLCMWQPSFSRIPESFGSCREANR